MSMLQVPGKVEFLSSLADPILDATRREDTKHALFRGCMDWCRQAVHRRMPEMRRPLRDGLLRQTKAVLQHQMQVFIQEHET